MRSGRAFLAAMGASALLILLLGFVPWERTDTVWRPAAAGASATQRYWSAEQIDKGRTYRSRGYARYFIRQGVVGLLLVGLIATGAHLAFRRLPFGEGIAGATVALLAALLALDLIRIPFGVAALQDARAFGLSKQSLGFWFADYCKGTVVALVTAGVFGVVLFALVKRFPRFWPFPATVAAGAGGLIAALLLPLVVDPLFNKFKPLEDEILAARFLELARQAGVPAREVLVTDQSRRTQAVNASFTGFGPTRRIVVYDTLVETLAPQEAELVLAHEIGHWAKGHIAEGLLLGTLGSGAAFLLAGLFLRRVFARGLFGLRCPLDAAAVPLFVLLYWFGSFAALPIENAVSRRMEREADRFALELTGGAATQISAGVKLGARNLNDVAPPPFIEWLLFTHPSPLDRIRHAEAYARLHPGSGTSESPP